VEVNRTINGKPQTNVDKSIQTSPVENLGMEKGNATRDMHLPQNLHPKTKDKMGMKTGNLKGDCLGKIWELHPTENVGILGNYRRDGEIMEEGTGRENTVATTL
jgi:hypothetical protein